MKQRKKLIYVSTPPEGLTYIPNFIDETEERQLIEHIVMLPFVPYNYRGYIANREVVYFSDRNDNYSPKELPESLVFPQWLRPVRAHFAELSRLAVEKVSSALIARYKHGIGIGWHRDRPQYGPTVFGLSLGTDAEMRFRKFDDEKEEMFKINLERNSAYIMSGESRSDWQHSMPPVTSLRYSITMRIDKP